MLPVAQFPHRLANGFAANIWCSRVPGLNDEQRQLCIEAPDAFIALGSGHKLSEQECLFQFRGIIDKVCQQSYYQIYIYNISVHTVQRSSMELLTSLAYECIRPYDCGW